MTEIPRQPEDPTETESYYAEIVKEIADINILLQDIEKLLPLAEYNIVVEEFNIIRQLKAPIEKLKKLRENILDIINLYSEMRGNIHNLLEEFKKSFPEKDYNAAMRKFNELKKRPATLQALEKFKNILERIIKQKLPLHF
jgi:hypothetical protein